jgi:aspartyl-tRNA(Asn)/glutamyl-tRNA(Gln) amidotransferase subunit A
VEFACGGWGTTQHLGTPWNPWDAEVPRTPGGSSSGSGVAVAARLAPWAIGTDTGGSIRMPASWCGITGLKTTLGRISTHGILPLSPSLDTPGPMARTVRDAALLYEILQGPDPLDPLTRGRQPADPMPTLERGVRGLRLARLPTEERSGVAAEVLHAYDRSLAVLAALGAEIVDVALPFRLVDFVSMTSIMQAEAYFLHGHIAEDPGLTLDEAVRRRLLVGAGLSAYDYLATLRRREQEVDQKETPTRFARFVNLLEMCALALPNGVTAEGLPTSLQIVCRGYEEALALRIGHAYQQATDWHERLPPAVGHRPSREPASVGGPA